MSRQRLRGLVGSNFEFGSSVLIDKRNTWRLGFTPRRLVYPIRQCRLRRLASPDTPRHCGRPLQIARDAFA
jgi:hypothetical protein